jgi:uncharacterized protein
MGDWRDGQELVVMEGRIKVPYDWAAGAVGSRYLRSLRDEKKFLGTRCPRCNIVYHIPRRNCPQCMEECSEWVELADTGTLVTYTTVRSQHPDLLPLPLPYGYGIVRLEGADTGFLHLLHEFEETQLFEGAAVEAVFREEREAQITDVEYFRPVGGVK